MRFLSFPTPFLGAVFLLAVWGCDTEAPSAPDAVADPSPLFSFNGTPPAERSPLDDLARNPSRSGYPHPLESSRGWGGGWDKWDIVDAVRREPAWYNGLAFCGGNRGYCGQPCGWRNATINFGQLKTFNQVAVWHHGVDHVPNVYNIQYWDGASWVTVFSTTEGRSYLAYPPGPPWYWYQGFSTPTVNTFAAVTGSKVRMELNNCGTIHGWIYEFEVYLSVVTVALDIKPGSDPNSINCNNDKEAIAVAILTTDDFDATTVDHTTVTFAGASETHVNRKTGEPSRHEEDVDGDGDVDLVFHFRLGETDLHCDATEGRLTGQTFDGQDIEGTDAVRMVGA